MPQQKKEVLVFDLNKTFYNKSSKDEFFKFVVSKKPRQAKYYLQMLYYELLLMMHQIRKTEFKENFFNYLDNLPPSQVEAYAKEFWENEFPQNFNKELLNRFKVARDNGTELFCATGGLEVYVKPLFNLFPISGFAGTQAEYVNGTYKVMGKACKDEEKTRRISKHYGNFGFTIAEAYSDSKEDILEEAEKAFLVEDGEIKPYPKNSKT